MPTHPALMSTDIVIPPELQPANPEQGRPPSSLRSRPTNGKLKMTRAEKAFVLNTFVESKIYEKNGQALSQALKTVVTRIKGYDNSHPVIKIREQTRRVVSVEHLANYRRNYATPLRNERTVPYKRDSDGTILTGTDGEAMLDTTDVGAENAVFFTALFSYDRCNRSNQQSSELSHEGAASAAKAARMSKESKRKANAHAYAKRVKKLRKKQKSKERANELRDRFADQVSAQALNSNNQMLSIMHSYATAYAFAKGAPAPPPLNVDAPIAPPVGLPLSDSDSDSNPESDSAAEDAGVDDGGNSDGGSGAVLLLEEN